MMKIYEQPGMDIFEFRDELNRRMSHHVDPTLAGGFLVDGEPLPIQSVDMPPHPFRAETVGEIVKVLRNALAREGKL